MVGHGPSMLQALPPTASRAVPTPESSLCRRASSDAIDPDPSGNTLDTILDTPEPSRADCFGGQELTFTAAGYAITNTWPGISLPPVLLHDWMLRADSMRHELIVSVPDTVALTVGASPAPSGPRPPGGW